MSSLMSWVWWWRLQESMNQYTQDWVNSLFNPLKIFILGNPFMFWSKSLIHSSTSTRWRHPSNGTVRECWGWVMSISWTLNNFLPLTSFLWRVDTDCIQTSQLLLQKTFHGPLFSLFLTSDSHDEAEGKWWKMNHQRVWLRSTCAAYYLLQRFTVQVTRA